MCCVKAQNHQLFVSLLCRLHSLLITPFSLFWNNKHVQVSPYKNQLRPLEVAHCILCRAGTTIQYIIQHSNVSRSWSLIILLFDKTVLNFLWRLQTYYCRQTALQAFENHISSVFVNFRCLLFCVYSNSDSQE